MIRLDAWSVYQFLGRSFKDQLAYSLAIHKKPPKTHYGSEHPWTHPCLCLHQQSSTTKISLVTDKKDIKKLDRPFREG